jgi:superfamily II DNA or RNA helicase
VGTGLFLHQCPALADAGYTFEWVDRRRFAHFYAAEDCQLKGGVTPYQWQLDAAEFVRENANTGGVIIAPTATGKTLLAALIFGRLAGRGLFLVDDRALGMQAKDELERYLGEGVGFVGDGKFSVGRITVALVQSMALNRNKEEYRRLGECDVMLIDELHVMINNRTWETLLAYQPLAVFGQTATLDLKNTAVAFPAMALCGSAVFEYTAKEARENAQLTQGWAYLIDVPHLMNGTAANYQELYYENVVRFDWLNKFVAALGHHATGLGYTVLILVRQLSHLYLIADELDALGASYVLYSGQQASKERVATRGAMSGGAVKLCVGTTGTITKGISIPALDFIIDAAQSKAWEHTVQRAGRGARNKEGKNHFVYVDIGQVGTKVRGVTTRNLFAKHATDRRKGLKQVGYHLSRFTVDSTNEPQATAVHTLNQIQLE